MNVTLKDGKSVKLGRRRPKAIHQHDTFVVVITEDGRAKTIARLAPYVDTRRATASLPEEVDWSAKAMASLKRVYLNDQYGDCVIAGKYHQVGIWSGNDTTAAVLGTDKEVLDAYHKICGPGDNGCYIPDVLDAFQKDGLTLNGVKHRIDGYLFLDHTNKALVQTAIYLFGSLTLGINLPNAWTCTNCTWDTTNSPIVGGHDVCVCGFTKTGVKIATWGGIVEITWAAFLSSRWIEESYVQLSPDWYNADNLSPNGVNVQALRDALAAIGGGNTPPIPDPGPVPPPIPPGPTPPPVPVPPVPSTFTINIPPQPVIGPFGLNLAHVNGFSVQGTINTKAGEQTLHLPPWLLPLLRQACAGAVVLPPPWGLILGVICGMVPQQGTRADLDGVTLTIPPWLMAILQAACASAANLPAPYNFFALAACSLLPASAKSPCGCK